MPGILYLGEITVTCQSSIKRGKILSLTFSRGLVFQTRTGSLRKGKKGPREGMSKKDRGSAKCPVFQTHPILILHLLCFLALFLLSSTSFSLQSSVLPRSTSYRATQKAECGYSNSVWRQSSAFFPPRCLTVCLPHWSTLKAEAPSINNPAFEREKLYLVLSFILPTAPSFHVRVLSGTRVSQVLVLPLAFHPGRGPSSQTDIVPVKPSFSKPTERLNSEQLLKWGKWQTQSVLLQSKNAPEGNWPEPTRIIALIHQNIEQGNRHWFSEAVIRKP